jgi:hypothetical protein
VIATTAAIALLLAVIIGLALWDNRARRKQDDAAEERQASLYWPGVRAALNEPYNALPWGPNPKTPGARIAALDPQQADRDFRASQAAGYVEELADYDLRRAGLLAHMTEADAAAGLLDQHVPTARKETQ